MTVEERLSEQQLIAQFLETLQGLPDVSARLDDKGPPSTSSDSRHDAQIDVQIAGKPFTLLIEAKKTVYPRDVRQVLWRFKDFSRSTQSKPISDEAISFLVAESISPGAMELLRDQGVGYYDSGGSLFLPARGAYLYIDKPPPQAMSKSVRSLFSGRRAQVLHALLVHHRNWFGVKELAAQALVSPATASQVLTELERYDWMSSRGRGPSKERHLTQPATLLDAWVKQLASIRAPAWRRYYVPSLAADKLLERIAQVFNAKEVEYAISYEAAAQRYAPFLSGVSQVRARLLASNTADVAIGELGARVVDEGFNLVLIEAKSSGELLFREQIGDVWVASPVQVYLDLLRGEGRAKEMAEHLRKERIGF